MARPAIAAWTACLALATTVAAAEPKPPAAPRSATPNASPTSGAIEWVWEWKPTKAEKPAVEVCPLQYDKKWAYSVEIDDGPASTFQVAAPLLAEFSYTDAPPGVSGGRERPFVGGAAVIVLRVDAGNDSFLTWEQLRELERRGWRTVNHSYWHSGNHWDPKAALDEAAVRRELFWSQALFAAQLGPNGAPTHFVYPNGYTVHEPLLAEYGLRSASRVGGTSKRRLAGDGVKWTDLDRNYLDENVWAKSNDPLHGLRAEPQPGDWIIDFTHGIDADPNSPNHRRWRERLRFLYEKFGKMGDDSLWCAPPSAVVAYAEAAKRAEAKIEPGRVTVRLPAGLAGTPLTLRLSGVDAESIAAPESGSVAKQGDRVWLTTPTLGPPGAGAPAPAIVRVYEGPVKDVKFERPVKLAAVRLRQNGSLSGEKLVKITALTPDGREEKIAEAAPGDVWGGWLLYPVVPDRAAFAVSEVKISPDKNLKACEIWAVKE